MSELMDMTPRQFETFQKSSTGIPIEVGIIRVPRYLKIVRSEEEQKFALFYLKECVRRANLLGISTCVFGSGDARSTDLNNEIEKYKLIDFLKMANEFCEENSVSLAIEAMSGKLCDTLNTVEKTSRFLVDNGLSEVGVVIDNFHMNDNSEKIENLAKVHQICHVHLSNPHGRAIPRESDEYDYQKLLLQLVNCGYQSRISIECDMFNNPENAKDSAVFLKRILEKIKE